MNRRAVVTNTDTLPGAVPQVVEGTAVAVLH